MKWLRRSKKLARRLRLYIKIMKGLPFLCCRQTFAWLHRLAVPSFFATGTRQLFMPADSVKLHYKACTSNGALRLTRRTACTCYTLRV